MKTSHPIAYGPSTFIATLLLALLSTTIVFGGGRVAQSSPAQGSPRKVKIRVEPFEVTVALTNWDATRAALAVQCSNGFSKFHQLDIRKQSGSLVMAMTALSEFEIDETPNVQCWVSLSVFTEVKGEGRSVRSSILGRTVSPAELQNVNLATAITRRLKNARIDTKTYAAYPYLEAMFKYSNTEGLGFCLEVIGRTYKVPFNGASFDDLTFGEVHTSDGTLAGAQLAGRGGTVYWTCNEGDRSLALRMSDPKAAPPAKQINTKATFNKDFSEMTIDAVTWKEVR